MNVAACEPGFCFNSFNLARARYDSCQKQMPARQTIKSTEIVHGRKKEAIMLARYIPASKIRKLDSLVTRT